MIIQYIEYNRFESPYQRKTQGDLTGKNRTLQITIMEILFMPDEVDAYTHYELLIDEGNDPVHDDDRLKQHMSNWDGPLFFESLDVNKDKSVLEIGVGTGRIAKQVLERGCKEFTGIDISPKTIKRAEENLRNFDNAWLIEENALTFVRENQFDVIYSVLTFSHIQDKESAIKNVWLSLKRGGFFVLSVSKDDAWLDYGSRKVKLFPENKDYYVKVLKNTGFRIEFCRDTESGFATIIKAEKV